MTVTVGVLSRGSLGHALGSLAGVRGGRSWSELSVGTDAVLVEAEFGLDPAALRASLGPGPALFLVAGCLAQGERGHLLVCPESETPPEVVAGVVSFLQEVAEVWVVSPEQLTVAVAFQKAAPALMTPALEGLEDGAVGNGLPAETAGTFGPQTLLGAALLLQEEDLSPADLKDRVASPGGTTIAGLTVLEEAAVRGAYIRSVLESCLPSWNKRGSARRDPVLE